MPTSKTGGPLKSLFDPAKKAAAAAVMEAQPSPPPVTQLLPAAGETGARNRKAGGRNVRISGYIPPELEAALRDEVIRRTVAERRTVSLNDVLCDALTAWQQGRAGQ